MSKVPVPCLLDPRHSVVECRQRRHFRVCTFVRDAAAESLEPFYDSGVNELPTNFPDRARRAVETCMPPHLQAEHLHRKRCGAAVDADAVLGYARRNVPLLFEKLLARLELLDEEMARDIAGLRNAAQGPSYPQLLTALHGCDPVAGRLVELMKQRFSPGGDAEQLSAANKHHFQCAALLTQFYSNVVDAAGLSTSALFVELGAGKGGLIKWFIELARLKSCSCDSGACVGGCVGACVRSDSGGFFVSVERASRRNSKEYQDFYGHKAGAVAANVMQVKVDLRNLNFSKLVNLDAHVAHPFAREPWVVQLLKEVGSLDRNVATDRALLERLAQKKTARGAEQWRAKLANARATTDCAQRPAVFLAKHLCGAGFDEALHALCKLRRDEPARRICAVLAPCCYHACAFVLGSETLDGCLAELGLSLAEFLSLRQKIVGWSTGAMGEKAALGRALKCALLGARLASLRKGGFFARPLVYAPEATSRENVVIVLDSHKPLAAR